VRRLLLLLTAALALAAPASAHAVVVGIADQKPDMFTDERFEDLGIRYARMTVAWDALSSDWQRAELDRWMDGARKAHVKPLLSFGPSRIDRSDIPTPERLKYEFKRFRKRYPRAKTWATWNEANHCGMRLCHRAKLVAAYYRKMRQACKRCTLLGAELLDMPNMLTWYRQFRRALGFDPKYWGLHNYVEANRFRTTSIKKLLRRMRGRLWLTEVGGIVKRRTKQKAYTVRRIPESEKHAYRVTKFIFRDVVKVSPRISRIYLYHWNSSSRQDTWDSALIGPTGKRRRAFGVVQREVERLEDRREERRRLRSRRAEREDRERLSRARR
jgi:hypothetical protein